MTVNCHHWQLQSIKGRLWLLTAGWVIAKSCWCYWPIRSKSNCQACPDVANLDYCQALSVQEACAHAIATCLQQKLCLEISKKWLQCLIASDYFISSDKSCLLIPVVNDTCPAIVKSGNSAHITQTTNIGYVFKSTLEMTHMQCYFANVHTSRRAFDGKANPGCARPLPNLASMMPRSEIKCRGLVTATTPASLRASRESGLDRCCACSTRCLLTGRWLRLKFEESSWVILAGKSDLYKAANSSFALSPIAWTAICKIYLSWVSLGTIFLSVHYRFFCATKTCHAWL